MRDLLFEQSITFKVEIFGSDSEMSNQKESKFLKLSRRRPEIGWARRTILPCNADLIVHSVQR